MIVFMMDKDIGFDLYFSRSCIIIRLLWFSFAWANREHGVRVFKVARLDLDILNDYSEINKIKGDEYNRGFRDGKDHEHSFYKHWESAYYAEKEKYTKLYKEMQTIKPKFEYLEQLVISKTETDA